VFSRTGIDIVGADTGGVHAINVLNLQLQTKRLCKEKLRERERAGGEGKKERAKEKKKTVKGE
jgi:hypothetical protein